MTSSKNASDKLADDLRPLVYDVRLSLDVENDTYTGDVTMTAKVTRPTYTLSLHAHDELAIGHITVTQDGRTQRPHKKHLDPATDHLTLTFERQLQVGTAVLRIAPFTGSFKERLVGFFRGNYKMGDADKKIYMTQFEPVHARRALPLRDELTDKAVFNVTLDVPEHLTTISNGEIESERYANGRKTVTFSPSPEMSSYLLAFIVGELESVETKTRRGVTVRGWATEGKGKLAKYAAELAAKCLDYYEEYFDRAYPLPKLDLIASPTFGGGAMENWGAITFRETCMLVDPDNCSQEQLQRVATVVAHEVAHQWFGNLTTMAEWSGLYLNESFATHLGTKVLDHLYPEWEVWKDFVAGECRNAMRLDGLRSTHPVEVPIPCSKDIDEIFDDISYDKGGSLLRMLESYLGETVFRDGMRIYMLRNAYSSTRTRHLWEALEYVSKRPVRELMSKWTDAPGYPVVRFVPKRVKNDLHLRMIQNRFQYDVGMVEDEWNVPIKIATGHGEFDFLLQGKVADMVIPGHFDSVHGPSWFYPNAGRNGFYRADVAGTGYRSLMRALRARQLSAEERLGVEDDAYALCRAGITDVDLYRETVWHYRNETESAVWESLLSNLQELSELLCDHPKEAAALQRFVRELTEDATAKTGWQPTQKDETSNQAKLRPLLLEHSGLSGNQATCLEAECQFTKALTDRESVAPDVRETVYKLAASRCDAEGKRLNELLSLYTSTDSQEEQDRVLEALGHISDPNMLKQVYELLDTPGIRSQDAPYMLDSARGNPALPADYGWEWVKARWPRLLHRYEGSTAILGLFVKKSTQSLAKTSLADDIEAFFRANPIDGLSMTVSQAAERVRNNARWLEQNLPLIAAWYPAPPAVLDEEPQLQAPPPAEQQKADNTSGDC